MPENALDTPANAPKAATRGLADFAVASRAQPLPTGPSLLDDIRAGANPEPTIHPELQGTDAVIRVNDFRLWYGQAQALHGISMGVTRGKVTAIIGPSGCGKSTLLRSVNRLNDLVDGVRTKGEILLNDAPIYHPSVDVIDLRKRIGMVFQKPNPFPMSIFENVVYPLRIDGERRRSALEEACERSLKAAALWDEVKDRLKDSALGLSGGQQQRLCIARAVVADPEVLLLDEPCSALDPIATTRVEELIHEIADRYTVLIVTHNMQQAARVSDFTAFMYLGRLLEYGPTAAIFQNPTLRETEEYVTGRFG
ncbi:MAG: phosphate ABC transporter ATP-binding protein PstB [Phycisphaerales bacterium]